MWVGSLQSFSLVLGEPVVLSLGSADLGRVGAMQGTLPMYLSEMAPTQLRGLFTQSYTFWFVIGQLLSSVPLVSTATCEWPPDRHSNGSVSTTR